MKCIVVDDEALARKLLEKYISQIPNLELIAMCKNPMEAAAVLQEQSVDVMFLDIQMPQITGISFLKSLNQKPFVVFTTAYEKYALEGYSLDVVDYLLKPFSFERFFQAVNKVSERLQSSQVTIAKAKVENNTKDYILVKSEHRVHRLKFSEIDYIESMQAYVAFHIGEKRILSLNTMKKLERELPISQFIRIHKSYIVAINKVELLEGNQVVIGKSKLPIGASYRERVLKGIF
ncbi:MAG: LytR/AlgR family response regulator transcription factor [Saprospiraceae bacterium]